MELERHIESLLLHNDCVMVPGMGGFISHYVPARYIEEEHTFFPPYKSLGFNPQLHINDSLLVQSYMTVGDLSYDEAHDKLKSDVDQVIATLRREGRYDFASLGVFTINEEGNMEFEPKESGILSPSLYGLDLFEFRTLTQQARLESLTDEEPYIRIKVRTLKTIAASAAAVFLGLLMVAGTFFGSNSTKFAEAGFVSISKMLPTTTQKQEQTVDAQFIATPQEQTSEATVAEEEIAVSDGFCIVLGCKLPKSNAEQYARSFRERGYDVEVTGSDKDSKVVYGNYSTDQEAYAALQQLQSDPSFANAWILHR